MRFRLTPDIHYKITIFGIALMLVALPLSMFLMSIAQFVLAINLVWEGNFKAKCIHFIKNKAAVAFSSLYLLHVLGLIYTSDFHVAWVDLRIKLPILIFPFIFVNIKFPDEKTFKALISLFISAVLFSTLCSLAVLMGIIHKKVTDIRDISIFISHIRLALLICLSIFLLFHRIYQERKSKQIWLPIYLGLIVWFIYFLTILESMTGISILVITSVVLLLVALFRVKKLAYKVLFLFGLLSLIFCSFYFLYHEAQAFYTERNSAKRNIKIRSLQGHYYYNDTTNHQIENANYVWTNIEWLEMTKMWNKRSKIPFEGLDEKKQGVKYTLIRFLASKGYDKDSVGVSRLSDSEIRSIEKGICNYRYQQMYSFRSRLHKIFWEYENYKESRDPSGHSATLRLEFWKTSFYLIGKNPMFGVGTGDIDQAFKSAYKETKTRLLERYRLKSHNEYLRITVLFGAFGLIWFLAVLLFPFFYHCKFDFYYLVFFMILSISMLTEDTIETQAGVSFYAFFSAFFYYRRLNHLSKKEIRP